MQWGSLFVRCLRCEELVAQLSRWNVLKNNLLVFCNAYDGQAQCCGQFGELANCNTLTCQLVRLRYD